MLGKEMRNFPVKKDPSEDNFCLWMGPIRRGRPRQGVMGPLSLYSSSMP